ncbi:hypothetical protein ACRAWF_22965 [Streptomyces sp. L7]
MARGDPFHRQTRQHGPREAVRPDRHGGGRGHNRGQAECRRLCQDTAGAGGSAGGPTAGYHLDHRGALAAAERIDAARRAGSGWDPWPAFPCW